MDKSKIIVNIFSNWTNFIVSILVAFFVSPIIIHSLGNENYGIWTLMVSITGYFTVLDFGVNTAIVRYISMYAAKKEYAKANEIYSTAFIFFIIIGVFIFIVTAISAYFFKDFFKIETLSREYLYFVFFLVGTDLAFSFVFSVYQATLCGMQDFLKINIISISTLLIKYAFIVILLLNGYSLLSLAGIQLLGNLLRALLQKSVIRKKHKFLVVQKSKYDKQLLKQIYSYSIYSFIIAIALKMLFFTDSIVIGRLISVSEVTFYAIPAMIMEYSEKLIWTLTAVLIPVISSYDAAGDQQKNKDIYVYGSKYSLILSIPIIYVLYTNGASFISIWMGEEYGIRAELVLRILVIGYAFYFPQMISHGILKGISKHKVFAYILIAEAVVNLGISILLAGYYGIEGVALGTAIPLVIVNIILVPAYTCYVLRMNMYNYIMESYFKPLLGLMVLVIFNYYFSYKVTSYFEFILYTLSVVVFMAFFSFVFVIEKSHRDWALNGIKNQMSRFF